MVVTPCCGDGRVAGAAGSETEQLLGALDVGLGDARPCRVMRRCFLAAACRRALCERSAGLAAACSGGSCPSPVTLNRLLAPECVLFFGICRSPLVVLVLAVQVDRVRSWRPRQARRSSGFDLGVEVLGAAALLLLRDRVPGVVGASRSARSSASAAARSAVRVSFSAAACSTLASAFFLCGPSTMIMLRPSCLGADSTKPSSVTSSASRCSSRNPSSGRCCSRPRNMIVILTLSPALRNRTT